jgi:hypothetical protein
MAKIDVSDSREEHGLKMSENRVTTKIFEPKRRETK